MSSVTTLTNISEELGANLVLSWEPSWDMGSVEGYRVKPFYACEMSEGSKNQTMEFTSSQAQLLLAWVDSMGYFLGLCSFFPTLGDELTYFYACFLGTLIFILINLIFVFQRVQTNTSYSTD